MGTVRSSSLAAEVPATAFRFITVDETRLRYLDVGAGMPVVLLHGNGSMIEDFLCSGVMEQAAPGHRFIAFDRPGFGYSERPHRRAWGPWQQASLLLEALACLNIERPIIVGHSWGALVALAMGLKRPEDIAGLVLMSGYYYPVPRHEAFPAAFPFAGDFFRHAVRRFMAPETLRRVFAPCTVPARFSRDFPLPLAMRASQMRVVDEEAAMLLDAARMLSHFYRDLRVPVRLVAGSNDRIVDTEQHTARLHRELRSCAFHRIPDCGHMVHHAAPQVVAEAIAAIGNTRRAGAVRRAASPHNSAGRQWLQIGEGLVAA